MRIRQGGLVQKDDGVIWHGRRRGRGRGRGRKGKGARKGKGEGEEGEVGVEKTDK